MSETRELKVILPLEDGTTGTCSVIEYEGAVWLVPKWLSFPSEGFAKPERMIRLDQFRHQKFDPPVTGPGPFAGAHFGINDPLPKNLFFGELSSQLKAQYVLLDHPDLRFRVVGTLH